jgi:hypothetical protein
MFCWYLRNTYLENKLRQTSELTVAGNQVSLERLMRLYLCTVPVRITSFPGRPLCIAEYIESRAQRAKYVCAWCFWSYRRRCQSSGKEKRSYWFNPVELRALMLGFPAQ